jgi:hypothetical protein
MYITELLRILLKTDKNAKIPAFDIPFKKGKADPLYFSLRREI